MILDVEFLPFLLENETIAGECGTIRGYVIALIVSIALLILGIFVYYKWRDDMTTNKILLIVGIVIVGIILSWLLIPMLMKWSTQVNWRSYNAQINAYESKGMNTKEAIDKLQDLYQTNIQADAINRGSYLIASSLASKK